MGIRIKKIKGKVIDIGDEVANEIVVRDAGISYFYKVSRKPDKICRRISQDF